MNLTLIHPALTIFLGTWAIVMRSDPTVSFIIISCILMCISVAARGWGDAVLLGDTHRTWEMVTTHIGLWLVVGHYSALSVGDAFFAWGRHAHNRFDIIFGIVEHIGVVVGGYLLVFHFSSIRYWGNTSRPSTSTTLVLVRTAISISTLLPSHSCNPFMWHPVWGALTMTSVALTHNYLDALRRTGLPLDPILALDGSLWLLAVHPFTPLYAAVELVAVMVVLVRHTRPGSTGV